MAPIQNPIRASLSSADDVEGVSMAYIIPLPRIPLWIRKGAVSGWVPRYGISPQKGVGCAYCGSHGCVEGCVLSVDSPAVSRVASTGRVDG